MIAYCIHTGCPSLGRYLVCLVQTHQKVVLVDDLNRKSTFSIGGPWSSRAQFCAYLRFSTLYVFDGCAISNYAGSARTTNRFGTCTTNRAHCMNWWIVPTFLRCLNGFFIIVLRSAFAVVEHEHFKGFVCPLRKIYRSWICDREQFGCCTEMSTTTYASTIYATIRLRTHSSTMRKWNRHTFRSCECSSYAFHRAFHFHLW